MTIKDHHFCVVHEYQQEKIDDIMKIQSNRACGIHAKEISILQSSDEEQWKAITELRKKVWSMSSLAAFIGSILGTVISAALVQFILKHHCK